MATNDPKVATEGQWEDLASRVKAKADAADVPSVVQTTGTSTTDVMSQNVVTNMMFADPANTYLVKIGRGASNSASPTYPGVAVGTGAHARANYGIAIGYSANAEGTSSIAIGGGDGSATTADVRGGGTIAIGKTGTIYANYAVVIGTSATVPSSRHHGSIALGVFSGRSINAAGMMDIGSSNASYGYNSSNYRLLTGLYDPQNDHDAATKGYVDSLAPSYGYSTDVELHSAITNSGFSSISTMGRTVTLNLNFQIGTQIPGGSTLLSYLPPAAHLYQSSIAGADGTAHRIRFSPNDSTALLDDSSTGLSAQWYSGQLTYQTNLEVMFGAMGDISSPADTVIARVHDSSCVPESIYCFSDYTDEITLPSQHWSYDSTTGKVTILASGYTYLASQVSGWSSGDKLTLYYELPNNTSVLLGVIGTA